MDAASNKGGGGDSRGGCGRWGRADGEGEEDAGADAEAAEPAEPTSPMDTIEAEEAQAAEETQAEAAEPESQRVRYYFAY